MALIHICRLYNLKIAALLELDVQQTALDCKYKASATMAMAMYTTTLELDCEH